MRLIPVTQTLKKGRRQTGCCRERTYSSERIYSRSDSKLQVLCIYTVYLCKESGNRQTLIQNQKHVLPLLTSTSQRALNN